MTYIVSGHHRSGTSMMMRALAESSKLKPVVHGVTEDRIRSREVDPHYNPNPNGYWMSDTDPAQAHLLPTDSLIKIHLRFLMYLEPGDWEIVLMARDEAERSTSFKKAFGLETQDWDLDMASRSLEAVKERPDISITTLNYADVIENPLREFQKLKAAGWPIDPQKAAETVDPKLYRNKVK